MKGQLYLSGLLLMGCVLFALQNDFSVLRGTYLGQKPPGILPNVFAAGIISTDADEGSSGFLKNGSIFIFRRTHADKKISEIYMTEMEKGVWR